MRKKILVPVVFILLLLTILTAAAGFLVFNKQQEIKKKETFFEENENLEDLELEIQNINQLIQPQESTQSPEQNNYDSYTTAMLSAPYVSAQGEFDFTAYINDFIQQLKESDPPKNIEDDVTALIAALEEMDTIIAKYEIVIDYFNNIGGIISKYDSSSTDNAAIVASFDQIALELEATNPPAGLEDYHSVVISDFRNLGDYLEKSAKIQNDITALGELSPDASLEETLQYSEQMQAYLAQMEQLNSFPELQMVNYDTTTFFAAEDTQRLDELSVEVGDRLAKIMEEK